MSIDVADYRNKTREAVKAFWGNREAARQKQIESGKADKGERAGVTAGKNMDGFLALVRDLVRVNGLEHADICLDRRVLTLPGYFRHGLLIRLLDNRKDTRICRGARATSCSPIHAGKEKRSNILVPQPAFDSNVARLGIVASDTQPDGILRIIGHVIPPQVGQLADS